MTSSGPNPGSGPRVLVTGALGNVGREVIRACLDAGLFPCAAGRRLDDLRRQFPNVECTVFDFLDRSSWTHALLGSEFLFLLRPPELAAMDETLNPFIDLAYEQGVRHIVFVSVLGAEQMTWVPHWKVERHLRESGVRWTVLRPGFFAQNLQDAYRLDIAADHELYLPAGNGQVAFLDVRDLAEVAAQIFKRPADFDGQAIELTGGERMTFTRVAELLSTELSVPIRYRAASVLGYVSHLRRRRRMGWMQILVQTYLHLGIRRGQAGRVVQTVQSLLGRPPRSMAQYIRDTRTTWI